MSAPFPRYNVTEWFIAGLEPAGDEPKFWLQGQAGETSEQSWLFKWVTQKPIPRRSVDGGGMVAYRRREDWVEKISSELADLVGIPAARVELAARDGVPGLISRDTKPEGWSLTGGGVLIGGVDPRYRAKTDSFNPRNRIGHNLDNVRTVLRGVEAPPGWVADGLDGFSVFATYLLLDAWIANRDRHEFNWAVLQDPADGMLRISPSFDHGAALGSGLTDDRLAALLSSDSVDRWCVRGTAHRFEDCHATALMDLAAAGLASCPPGVRAIWQNVADITRAEWQSVLSRMPALSEVAATFVDEVLASNQGRVRDVLRRT